MYALLRSTEDGLVVDCVECWEVGVLNIFLRVGDGVPAIRKMTAYLYTHE